MAAAAFENINYAPGMRVVIRDEEWMVRKVETNALGGSLRRSTERQVSDNDIRERVRNS
jgi:hypothetical protein